ncbi:peptide/nickel transport system substrate-binding protein [Halogranum rubrum]|uniref:Peptide/nickel transport system substrate-binding protein n=1 Tax=Halogranum rubrum TaxID=553466 RepID=A0A1I4FCC2_9EURY|nr:ABC transporter substrate-binding protein [Halogranum rubrum]SFL15578.1 peptide/nickel transport system substrate-binding protein [Halogranum rubrum]
MPVLLAGCTSNSGDGGDGNASGDGGSGSTGTDAQGSGGSSSATINIGQSLNPVRFDPITQLSNPDALVANRVFSQLYTYGEGTDVVPNLATDMPTIERDNTRYIVDIVEDATFHNGDPVTAEDVAYSFLAPIEEETPLLGIFSVIDSAEAIDDTTVQFDLANPYAMFQHVLTHQVVPKAVREEDKEAFSTTQPIGSGPFKFVEWEESNYVTLERWDDYWGEETPNVAGVEFTPIGESTTRVTNLKTGEVDVIETIPPKLWDSVESAQDTSISAVESVGYFYVAFNCNEGPTADKRVREAIDYSFSMDDAVERYIAPAGLRQYGPLPGPMVEEWDMPLDQWKQYPNDKDVEQATSLFEEAGVPADWDAKIIVPPDDNRENIGLSIANGIKEAGYEAHVERLDWGAMLSQAYTGNASDYNIYVLGWVRYPDPDDFMFNLFHEESEGVNQGVYYKNDEVMEQIKGARESTDRAERQQLYQSAIGTLLEDKVHLPAFNYKNSYGVKSSVKDFQVHPVSPQNPRLVTSYNNVSVDK